MADSPFALIGVNSDNLERAKEAVSKNNLNWRSFQNSTDDREASISSDWCVKGWPTIVVLDVEMRIQYRGHDGHAATDTARRLVEELTSKGQ